MSKSNEKLAQNTLKTLEKEFVVVGKTRVRSWHAWLAIGIAVGISAGILYVANRSGEFESGSAQTVPPAPTSYILTIGKTPLATVGLGRTATNKRVDQSFIAPTDLPLQSVKLALTQKGIPTQQITVSIRETRSGPDLTSALLTPIAIPTSAPLSLADAELSEPAQPTYVQGMVATFKSPITLTPERKYFLVLTADTVNYNNFYRVAVDNQNPYSGGNVIAGGVTRRNLDAVASLTFAKPTITVLSPNGGETWQVGATHTISYKFSFTNDSTLIYLDRYHPAGVGKTGINSSMLIGETASGVSSFSYTVPEIVTKWPGLGSEYKIRVCIKNSNCTVSDSSDAYFSIVAPQVSNKFRVGDRIQTTKGPINVRSCWGINCDIIGSQEAGAQGVVSIPPPNPIGTSNTYPAYADGYWWWNINFDYGRDGWVAEDYLEKAPPSIAVLSPNGGEKFYTGQIIPFSWQWSGSSAPLQPSIYLYSVTLGKTIYGTMDSSNISYQANANKQVGNFDALLNYPSVSIPDFVLGAEYQFKICEYPEGTNNPAYPIMAPMCDFSDAPFSITNFNQNDY